jgi:hypothetical protein
MKMKSIARILAPLAVAALLVPTLSLPAQSTPSNTQNGIDTPKVEVFLGYSRFGTLTDKVVDGNRIVDMNGGSASVAYNFNRWIGLVADIGGYDDNKVILTGSGTNEPLTLDSTGRAYTYLFGPRLSYRNASRFTPFVQGLVGGIRAGEVDATGCVGSPDCIVLPIQNALAVAVGGGLDFRLTRHFSLRPVQAEYMMTRFADVAYGSTGKATTQNDLRLSSGIVFAFGGKPPLPVQLTCSIQPATAYPGDPLTATAVPTNLNPKHHATYTWTTTGGTVAGTDTVAAINTKDLAPGTYTVTGHVVEGKHVYEQASCTSSFTVQPFDPPTISCSSNPSTVQPGDPATITSQGVSPQNRPLTYSYAATAGTITGNTSSATLSTASTAPGPITVTCSAVDDLGKSVSSTTTVTVNAPPAPPVVAPETRDLCAVSFERDHKRPERVDNEAKGCLDTIALDMQREPASHLVVVGNYAGKEKPVVAARRSMNVRQYMINEKGIDPARIDIRTGTNSGRTASNVFVPEGATFADTGTTPVDPTLPLPGESHHKRHHHKSK